MGVEWLKSYEWQNENNINILIFKNNKLKWIGNIEERRKVFMDLVSALEKQPDSYFCFSPKSFNKLLKIIKAFNINWDFNNTRDSKRANLLRERIEKSIVKSVWLKWDIIEGKELIVDFFEKPSNFSFFYSVRGINNEVTTYTYYFTKGGVRKKTEKK